MQQLFLCSQILSANHKLQLLDTALLTGHDEKLSNFPTFQFRHSKKEQNLDVSATDLHHHY